MLLLWLRSRACRRSGSRLARIRGWGWRWCAGFAARSDLTARDRKRGEQAAGGLRAEGLSARLEVLDVRDGASVTAVAHAIAQRHGGVDIVISNAMAASPLRCPPSSRSVPSLTPTTTAPSA